MRISTFQKSLRLCKFAEWQDLFHTLTVKMCEFPLNIPLLRNMFLIILFKSILSLQDKTRIDLPLS